MCRNVLIYFDRVLQDRAVGLFREALVLGGFLGLGSKETLQFSEHAGAFTEFTRDERIYQEEARMSAAAGSFDLVAIGASAGGFSALCALLPSLRPPFPAAVVVVLHLPARGPSVTGEALATRCALPVREAFDKEVIEPGNVYLAPPDYHLQIEPEPQIFALSIDERVHFSRPSIDVMLESAAYAYRDRMIGAVLTGAGEDGAAGLECVRALGGTTWVQAPDTAAVATMPRAALRRGCPDRILTLPEMAAALERLPDDR